MLSAAPSLSSYLAWWVLSASLHQMHLLSVFPGNKFALFLKTRDTCQYSEGKNCLLSFHFCDPQCHGSGSYGLIHPLWCPPSHPHLTVALRSADTLAWLGNKMTTSLMLQHPFLVFVTPIILLKGNHWERPYASSHPLSEKHTLWEPASCSVRTLMSMLFWHCYWHK